MTKININDFETVRVQIEGKNFTSGMKIDSIQLISFSREESEGWCLSLPKNSCALNHSLELTIKIIEVSNIFQFSSTVKVNQMSKEELLEIVTVSFVQYEKKDLANFYHFFEAKQKSIHDLFKNLKG